MVKLKSKLFFFSTYFTDRDSLIGRMNYLHNNMQIQHDQIVKFSGILLYRQHRVKDRHEFLKLIGKAQYDPTKDLYVSLQQLMEGSDTEFAMHVCKTTHTQFENFLRQF